MNLEPEHLSTYELTLEPWTAMGKWIRKEKASLPNEEIVIEMYEWTREYLNRQGYEHYDVEKYQDNHRPTQHSQQGKISKCQMMKKQKIHEQQAGHQSEHSA